MKVGVKVGLHGWREILLKTQVRYCEVWYRVDWQEKYTPLFKFFKKNKIAFGLHFWAQVQGKYYPNLLYLKGDIAEETFKLIKKTLEVASNWQATYINFHPESYRLNHLDLGNSKIKTLNPEEPIDKEKSFKQLLFYLKKIKRYGEEKGVIPFIETVPKYGVSDFKNIKVGRLNPQKAEGLETEKFFKLARLGFPICFDIGHTIGQCITDDRDKLFAYLLKAAKKMRPAVGLVHVTTTIPPFNGTDSHNGVLAKDFKRGVLPSKIQLIKLLSLINKRDIWLIPEPPKGTMVENYFALQDIVKEVGN